MGQAVTEMRDLLMLASLLRRCAQAHAHGAQDGLFLETAAALEAHAFAIAITPERCGAAPPSPCAAHTSVNLVV